MVGLPGIEPGLHAPHARVLPLYYSPVQSKKISSIFALILTQGINFSRFDFFNYLIYSLAISIDNNFKISVYVPVYPGLGINTD